MKRRRFVPLMAVNLCLFLKCKRLFPLVSFIPIKKRQAKIENTPPTSQGSMIKENLLQFIDRGTNQLLGHDLWLAAGGFQMCMTAVVAVEGAEAWLWEDGGLCSQKA